MMDIRVDAARLPGIVSAVCLIASTFKMRRVPGLALAVLAKRIVGPTFGSMTARPPGVHAVHLRDAHEVTGLAVGGGLAVELDALSEEPSPPCREDESRRAHPQAPSGPWPCAGGR